MNVLGAHYSLSCAGCGAGFADDGLLLICPQCREGSLLTAEYPGATAGFHDEEGIFRYRDWLPVRRVVPGSSRPVVFRDAGVAAAVGVADLWLAFSGSWPERGCAMSSVTFKDLEAYAVLGRLPSEDAGVLVIPSAGNTAAAFAAACGSTGVRCLLVVPEHAVDRVVGIPSRPGAVTIVAVAGGTYQDAIDCAQWLARRIDGLIPEGGVRNVARRDGLGVVMLTAYEQLGTLPDFYFQAVGSAAGALGVYQAASRLRGPAAGALPRMMLCQNEEYAPLYHRWHFEVDEDRPIPPSHTVFASELLNAHPPYQVAGGVRDMLTATSGQVLVTSHKLAEAGAAMLRELTSVRVAPAAGVAVASLREAVASGSVPRDARVLLNITGGTSGPRSQDWRGERTEVGLVVTPAETRSERTALSVDRLVFPQARSV